MTAKLVIGNYNYSSWSLRAWLVATMSGLEFEVTRLVLDTPQFAKQIGTYSSAGQVPVLRDELVTIWDSLAICEYLNERFPQANLWPAERGARAMARSVSAEMHSGFSCLRTQMPMNCRARNRQVTMDAGLRKDIARIDSVWGSCLQQSGGPFLFGEFTIADAMYAPVVSRFGTYSVRQGDLLQAYRKHVTDLPAMQLWYSRAAGETEINESEEIGL